MKSKNEQRSLLSRAFFAVVGGCLYVSLLIQPACPGSSDPEPEQVDASSSLSLIDAALDAGSTTSLDASTTTIAPCWASAAGTYGPANQGCGIASDTVLSVSGDSITLTPFGMNASATFSGASGNEVTATGLIILEKPNHTCKLTCGASKIDVACTNPSGGSCTQSFNKK